MNPSHVISVIDPGYAPETPPGVSNHLKLGFDDIIEVNPKNQIFRLNTDEIPQLPPNQDHINSIKNLALAHRLAETFLMQLTSSQIK